MWRYVRDTAYDFDKHNIPPSSRIQRLSSVTEDILSEVTYKFSTLLPLNLDWTILETSSNISRRINMILHEMMNWGGGEGRGLPSYLLKSQ